MNNTKKKALIVAYNDLNNSGVPFVIFNTIKALSDIYSFDIIVFNDDYYYLSKIKVLDKNVNIIKINNKKPSNKVNRIFWYLFLKNSSNKKQIKVLIKNKCYSAIHCFSEFWSWPFLKEAKNNQINKRILHSNIDHKRTTNFLSKIINSFNQRKSIKYATNLIGVSKRCCKHAFGSKKSTILYNPVDNLKYSYHDIILSKTVNFAQVGSFSSNKNQIFSIKLINELKKRQMNVLLYLVGSNKENSYCNKLNSLIKKNKLNNNVIFENCDCKINELYKKINFVLIPSKFEGASIVAIEAQFSGVQTLCSKSISLDMNIGGIKFLDLKKGYKYWADIIEKMYKINPLHIKCNSAKFYFDTFQKNLKKIYLEN